MEAEVLIDYASPCMAAEKALKDLHRAMLERNFEQAIEHGMKALVEVRLTINSIKHTIETEAK